MFISENGGTVNASETFENEQREAQAKRKEAEKFRGQLTAKLSEVAGAVSAIVGLEPIGKAMQTCAVAEKDFKGYVLKEPVAQEEIRPRVSDLQALNERVREHELFQAVKKATYEEFARLDAREKWEASKQAAATPSPTTTPPALPVVAAGASGGVEPVTGKRWTPEKIAELKSYREKHGTKKAAEFFGISAQLIRKKLPSEKPQPKGYSAFTHRTK